MNKISFDDIGNVMATFYADEGVEDGQVVKVTGNGTVGACAEGDGFCGVAGQVRKGAVAVQVGGFMHVKVTGEVELGRVKLAADGKGGVKAAEDGVQALVVQVEQDGKAVICL
ncbi:MAG: hypothetical protein IJA11_06635 [Oscillospiraceae bacterium]|nr:hypothetical protein [Oscillospiraceae bacterium]